MHSDEKGTHICDDRCGATVDTGAAEISDESIQATTIDPLRTQTKSKSKKAKLPLIQPLPCKRVGISLNGTR